MNSKLWRRITAFALLLLFASISFAESAYYLDESQAYRHSEKTATDISQLSITRINELDTVYSAVIAADTNDIARQATKLDALSSDLKQELSLGGMTILVKDNIDVKGYATTAGSLALENNLAQQDSELVKQLRESGALILGKTNLSEWANFRSERSVSGWSAIGGQTRNAIDPDRSACGSSSGSAVSVALSYTQVAIGTETDGSIVCPASVNGVVGFKPTHGLVSTQGIVPLAASQDTAGPIARSVEDAAHVLSAMIDPKTERSQSIAAELSAFTESMPFDELRIGILSQTLGYDTRRDQLFNTSVELIRSFGIEAISDAQKAKTLQKVEIIEGLEFEPYDGFWQDSYDLLLYEFKRDINRYLDGLKTESTPANLDELIQFNHTHADPELTLFDQSIFIKSENLNLT